MYKFLGYLGAFPLGIGICILMDVDWGKHPWLFAGLGIYGFILGSIADSVTAKEKDE